MRFFRSLVSSALVVALVNATEGCTLIGTVIGASIPERQVSHSTELHAKGPEPPAPTWPPEHHRIEMTLADGDRFSGYFEGVENGTIKVDAEDREGSVFPVSRVESISWTTREGSHIGTGFGIGLLLDAAA